MGYFHHTVADDVQGYMALLDLLLAIIPARIIWKLQIATRLKAILVSVMGMGVL